MRLAGKVAIVTGSSRGIGRGIAACLASEGATVVVHGLHADRVAATEAELRDKGHEVLGVAADLSASAGADLLFRTTMDTYGPPDVLVNNAAWALPEAHFLEMSEEHWDRVMRTNLYSVFFCSNRAALALVDAGKPGSIISIGSYGGARAHRMMAAYDTAKGGIEAFSRALALDLAPFGIRSNVVAPGPIATESFDSADPVVRESRVKSVPLGRVGQPDDVGRAVAFLASDDGAFITGQVLYVDGGVLAQLRPPQIDAPLPTNLVPKRVLG